MKNFRFAFSQAQKGFTLIELMIVVTIAVVVMAAVIPQLKPALEQGRIREASRQVSTYLTLAKSLAIQKGLPVGVAFQRAAPGSNACMDMYMVETPTPYSGDIIGATAVVYPVVGTGYVVDFDVNGTGQCASLTANSTWDLVKPGESCLVRFNYQGAMYRVQRSAAGVYVLQIGSGQPPPGFWYTGADMQWGSAGDDDGNGVTNDLREAGWPSSDEKLASSPTLFIGQPFQVYLHPTRAAVKPLQLTAGTAIALGYSGYTINGQQFSNKSQDNFTPVSNSGQVKTDPVVVMFSPGGGVPTLYYTDIPGTTVETAPTGSIYFLVGQFEKVEFPPTYDSATSTWTAPTTFPDTWNGEDANSVWVTIEPHSGTISSAENVARPVANPVAENREIARTGQLMRGS